MSSHREAPEIAKDPVADSTDVYAFVSPDDPTTVTLIANYIPLQAPAGGPNFYEFGDDVLYEINIDNTGDGKPDISYQFSFTTSVSHPGTFLYNSGPITSLNSAAWNRKQTYAITKVAGSTTTVLAKDLACPPCNIGPLSTPNYPNLAAAAVHSVADSASTIKVFAGQRADGFYVDLGSIFDLGDLRPFEELHAQYGLNVFHKPGKGVNTLNHLNVHTIALQVPIKSLLDGTNPSIGVWTTASRRSTQIWDSDGSQVHTNGPWRQVSRLGNPLVNEVIIAMGQKDLWNTQTPDKDIQFVSYFANPALAGLLPSLYPTSFPNLAALNAKLKAQNKVRADIEAIMLTGIGAGVISGFQNTIATGTRATQTPADMLRLNTSITPTPVAEASIYGVLGNDLGGYPNGRRVYDDVVAIALRAMAGATYPLVDSTYTPDKAATALTDGLTPRNVAAGYLNQFPYLGTPYSGFANP